MIKTCAKLIDENKEYTNRLGFKVTEKEKTLPFMYCIFKVGLSTSKKSFIYFIESSIKMMKNAFYFI